MDYSLPGFSVCGVSRRECWGGCHRLLHGHPLLMANTNGASPSTLLLFFFSFLQARPKVINASSAHVWVQYEPTSLPTLTEFLLKFASLGWSSCLCWNMNLKGAISGPYACLAVSNWSLGPERSCLERTLSSDEETKVMVFWIKSVGFPLLLPSHEVLSGWTESSSLK